MSLLPFRFLAFPAQAFETALRGPRPTVSAVNSPAKAGPAGEITTTAPLPLPSWP